MSDKKEPHLINDRDLELIISTAKGNYINTTLPMMISGEQITAGVANHVMVMEVLLGYLNKNGLLTNMVKFDHNDKKIKK